MGAAMPVALSEMSREALVRELRFAFTSRNLSRVASIKYYLAKSGKRRDTSLQPAVKPKAYVDD